MVIFCENKVMVKQISINYSKKTLTKLLIVFEIRILTTDVKSNASWKNVKVIVMGRDSSFYIYIHVLTLTYTVLGS